MREVTLNKKGVLNIPADKKNKTVLIIAHRMRTVSSADKIVVLKDGTVAEQGSPAQLLHDGGIFDHMVQLQTKSQGWSLTKA